MKSPMVTVLMPVFNGAEFLGEAIKSILDQTYTDFEFLIIDDGSTDGSVGIIRSFSDHRIVLMLNERNLGIAVTLNRGIDLAKGKYIARMDCDDVSFPDRIAKQVMFMDQHPEVGVCGAWMEFSDSGLQFTCPSDHESIKQGLLEHTQLAHPTVILRTEVLRQEKLYYDPAYPYAQDYELWVRMSRITRLANIPEVLLRYRVRRSQISKKYAAEQQSVANLIRLQLYKEINHQFTGNCRLEN